MIEVRRPDDDELCGFVDERPGAWHAITVFGGHLGVHACRAEAEHQVLDAGLASLAERWTLINGTSGAEQVVCIQEAGPAGVTLALGYYSLPGVPTIAVSRADLAAGRWRLHHTSG